MKEQLMKDRKISGNAKILYSFLLQNGETTLKNKELADMFSVTTVSITLWLNKLESAGYIKLLFEKRKRTIVAIEAE
jgi:DNA-binding MarR family transcriptional regulator